ncbi:MAG: hypothetical protein WD398_08625 [Cyclobacteriaceae bacterium]
MTEVGFLGGELSRRENGIRLLNQEFKVKDGHSAISFELSEKWENLYGILRGLSEFYKCPVAYLKSNHHSKSFTLYFEAEAKKEVNAFLELLFKVLDREMQFKSALKQLISARNRYEKENELLVKELF